MSSTNPLRHQELAQVRQAPGGKRQAVVGRSGLGDLLDLPLSAQDKLRRSAALVLRVQETEAIGIEVADYVADPVLAGKLTFAIPVTSIPWADSSTICARRQVTTDPLS
jgi:hypothetical protein